MREARFSVGAFTYDDEIGRGGEEGAHALPHDGVVVDEGKAGRGDLLAELAGEERGRAPDGVAGGSFEEMAEE